MNADNYNKLINCNYFSYVEYAANNSTSNENLYAKEAIKGYLRRPDFIQMTGFEPYDHVKILGYLFQILDTHPGHQLLSHITKHIAKGKKVSIISTTGTTEIH